MTRRDFLRVSGGVALGAAVASGVVGSDAAFIEPNDLVVERSKVRVRGLPSSLDGFRIVLLSDIHLHPFTQIGLIHEAVEKVNRLQPDLILLGGDYVYSTAEAAYELAPALARLNAKHGLFCIFGNHDHYCGVKTVGAAFRRSGLKLLVNQGLPISVNRGSFYLAGLDSVCAGQPDLHAAIQGRREDQPLILLAHEPDPIDVFRFQAPIALQLSGHSHGGQVRLPFIGPLILPVFAERYPNGLYRVGDSQVYTSRGIGVIKVPFRFDCPPEITEITLVG